MSTFRAILILLCVGVLTAGCGGATNRDDEGGPELASNHGEIDETTGDVVIDVSRDPGTSIDALPDSLSEPKIESAGETAVESAGEAIELTPDDVEPEQEGQSEFDASVDLDSQPETAAESVAGEASEAVDAAEVCVPTCEARVCGDNGCGGSCGNCVEHFICDAGACVYVPWCGDATCDAEENCSDCVADCSCIGPATCYQDVCCSADCSIHECGDDGCGGGCGDCGDQEVCLLGSCVCDDGYHVGSDGSTCTSDPCDPNPCTDPNRTVCTGSAGAQPSCACIPDSVDVGACLPKTAPSDLSAIAVEAESGMAYVSAELMIYIADASDPATVMDLVESLGGAIVAFRPGVNRAMVRFPGDITVESFRAAREALRESSDVVLAIENWVLSDELEPNDPWDDPNDAWSETNPDGSNWYLEMIRAPSAWEYARGSSVNRPRIGIIDSGVPVHRDLRALDPSHVRLQPESSDSEHGKQVAGIVAAIGDNDTDLTGLLWNSELYYCERAATHRILPGVDNDKVAYDGDLQSFLECFRWLLENGVRVVNYSAGYQYRTKCDDVHPWTCDYIASPSTSYEALRNREYLQQQWTIELSELLVGEDGQDLPWVLVKSAGNENLDDASFGAPQLLFEGELRERTLVVGAVDPAGDFSEFCNHGPLDILAPGGTGNRLLGGNMLVLSGVDSTKNTWGTSLSAPLVAGAAALAWSVYPDLASGQLVDAVIAGSSWRTANEGTYLVPILDVRGVLEEVIIACQTNGWYFDPLLEHCQDLELCVPVCEGNECGDDGCTGSCGTCTQFANSFCSPSGVCDCAINCDGKLCGDDGCGGSCGTCTDFPNSICSPTGLCDCAIGCEGKLCGDDGCGGLCGTCPDGQVCGEQGQCVTPRCEANCGEMVSVPGGPFQMGCSTAEYVQSVCYSNESPYHQVDVPTFEIDKYEVTVSLYKACVDAGGCTAALGTEHDPRCNSGAVGLESHPVNCVDWNQAKALCAWAGKRTCSESEWEKAARGTDERIYPWGNHWPYCEYAVMNDGVYYGCGADSTMAVGSKPAGASPYGAMDMVGNVWEWVDDYYHSTYVDAPTNGSSWVVPSANYRVYRGGGVYTSDVDIRPAHRWFGSPKLEYYFLGVRCCRSPAP